MSTSVPAKENRPQGPKKQAPPEEKFWKHYSPHGEAPLSLAGSFALHALTVGGLMLFGAYLATLFFKPTRSLPVEPVRIALPGGGGKRTGQGEGKGVGTGALQENIGENRAPESISAEEEPKRPDLNPVEKAKLNESFDANSVRYIAQSTSESAKAFARLDEKLRDQLRPRDGIQAGKGQGGTGSGGGEGAGTGTGQGSGSGEGKASLTKRERRMLRWHMKFTAASGVEYVGQLRALGAFLAFPISDEPGAGFRIVRDLRPGSARLVDEDVSRLQRIYWVDDNPRSTTDVLAALNLPVPRPAPTRFVAFLPPELETKLFDLERRYVERVLRRSFDEDKIEETNFRVVPTARGYQPELIGVRMGN